MTSIIRHEMTRDNEKARNRKDTLNTCSKNHVSSNVEVTWFDLEAGRNESSSELDSSGTESLSSCWILLQCVMVDWIRWPVNQ